MLRTIAFVSFFIDQCFSLGLFGLQDGYAALRLEMNAIVQSASTKIETRFIDQPLDHFDKNEKRIWPMRYFERLDLWRPGGPMYFFIGGEGEAHPGFLKGGLIYELAKETNGAMFMSEHRYYGKSMPVKYKGVKSLKYLSSRQALADLARMVKRFKTLPIYKNSKVVMIGGSYPGNLAAWFRLLYPNLVDAALASSAPVLSKKNFYEYLETVSDDYEQYGTPGCHDFIRKRFEGYENSFKTEKGIEKLKADENICEESDMTRPENQQLFVYSKSGSFMVRAQYGNEMKIKQHCEKLMNDSRKLDADDLDFVYTEQLNKYNFFDRSKECYDLDFNEIIDEIRDGGDWLTSWVYQMCTEFSYAKSTSSDEQPFGKNIPIETFYKICSLSFGIEEEDIEKAVKDSNELYGGLTPNVTKVVFVNGELDPWHRLGVLEDVSYDAPAKFIPRSSHCRDLGSNRKGDPDELIETRKYIKYLIKSWIGIEECDFGNPKCSKDTSRM